MNDWVGVACEMGPFPATDQHHNNYALASGAGTAAGLTVVLSLGAMSRNSDTSSSTNTITITTDDDSSSSTTVASAEHIAGPLPRLPASPPPIRQHRKVVTVPLAPAAALLPSPSLGGGGISRRTLFGDILSAVVSSTSSARSPASASRRGTTTAAVNGDGNDSVGVGQRRDSIGAATTAAKPGVCRFGTTSSVGGNSGMQQLSTSWEYLRPTLDIQDVAKDDQHDMAPPRFIEVQKGKISLGPVPVAKPAFEATKDKEVLEARILELEEALQRLQRRVNESQCSSPTLEKDLRDQIETMNRSIKSKERRALQVCREHKALQARFHKQESNLQCLSSENESLQRRVRQYECCLDDVMRKVVDALVAEDNLREEVTKLKNRVRDLEAQNAALSPASSTAAMSTMAATATAASSSQKTRGDEGYCTMSTGQPAPGADGHLEDLPEEPEQMFVLPEPCSAELEEWSMSQEELGAALEEDVNEADWLWNSSSFLNSTLESQSESISQLLENTIEYSEDEEIGCKDFTRDFYKLVNIASNSTRSLQSPCIQAPACLAEAAGIEADRDETDSDTDSDGEAPGSSAVHSNRLGGDRSPTPSEAGLALVSSCSSSDASASTSSSSTSTSTDDRRLMDDTASVCSVRVPVRPPPRVDSLLSSSANAAATTTTTTASTVVVQAAAPSAATSKSNGRVLRPPRSSSSHGLHSFTNGGGVSRIATAAAAAGRSSAPPPPAVVDRLTASTRRSSSDSRCGGGSSSGGTTTAATQSMPTTHWRSTGWRRVTSQQHITESAPASRMPTPKKDLKTPPPVPARRSYAS